MNIHINSVNISHKGKLRDVVAELKSFNVVFSGNEGGKTLLVEFIIESLFKSKKLFKDTFRDITGEGKVIFNVDNEEFLSTPKSSVSLESIMKKKGVSLPVDIARLMVVRGADIDIDKSSYGGVGRDVVRKILSKTEILEDIEKKAGPSALKNIEIDNGNILQSKSIANTNIIKNLNDATDKLKKAQSYLARVDDVYYNGKLSLIEKEVADLSDKYQSQLLAKKKHAYTLVVEQEELSNKLKDVDFTALEKLRGSVFEYLHLKKDIARLESEIRRYQDESKNYLWLVKLQEQYESSKNALLSKKSTMIASLVLLVVFAVVSITIQLLLISYVAVAMLSVWALYFVVIKDRVAETEQKEQRKKIDDDFYNRTGFVLTKPALSQAIIKEEDSFQAEKAGKMMLKQRKEELLQSQKYISSSFIKINKEEVLENDWESAINDALREHKNLELRMKEISSELEALDVDEPFAGEVDVTYTREQLLKFKQNLDKKKEEQAEEERIILNTKQEICFFVGSSIGDSWEDTVMTLEKEVQSLKEEINQLTTDVISRKFVLQAASNIKSKEDEMLEKTLSSNRVGELISLFTSNYYKSAHFLDNDIIVSSSYGDFKLGDLSTGTREQVVLALRVVFLEQLQEGNKSFLILDDAFQHSDYKRREEIVKTLKKLAQNGWQIIYLTMDNHLLELFEKEGSEMGNQYSKIIIKND